MHACVQAAASRLLRCSAGAVAARARLCLLLHTAAAAAAAQLQRLPSPTPLQCMKLVQRRAAGAGSLETLYSRTLAPNLSTLPTRSCLATWSGGVGRWLAR